MESSSLKAPEDLSGFKSSQFNEYLGQVKENSWAIHNHITSAMFEVPQYISDALEKKSLDDLKNPETIALLKRGKFIVPKDLDEEKSFIQFRNTVEDEMRVIGLQILPTMKCNFKCSYCYENTSGPHMSQDVQEAILEYIKNKILPTTEAIHTCWFGGEPLVHLKCIQYLSEKFIEIAKQNSLKYSSLIITNGYLLTRETVDLLIASRINTFQITLDGPERIHDKRRMTHNNKGTFNQIIRNLEYLLTKPKVAVALRVNIDRTNINYTEELLQYLERVGIIDKVSLSFGIVSAFNNVCKSFEENVLSLTEIRKFIDDGRLTDLLKKTLNDKILIRPQPVGCVATARHSLIVGPEGEIYKCSKTIGEEKEICGNIRNPDYEHHNFKKWIQFKEGHAMDKQCQGCSMYPICQGSVCPFDYITGKKKTFVCEKESKKQNVRESLRANYLRKIKQGGV